MAEVSTRYVSARDTLAQRRKDVESVRAATANAPIGREGAQERMKVNRAMMDVSKAQQAFDAVKPEYDQWNESLARASQQTIANTGIVNQRAAMTDAGSRQEAAMSAPPQAALALDGADGTPEARGEFDTETPGGASGRRRRNATAVGSIRI